MYKKIGKLYELKHGEYFTVIPLLKDFAKLLNKSKLGILKSIQESKDYDRLNSELLDLQLKLNIPDKYITDINRLPDLSYGLFSISVGMHLITENRKWLKDIPDSYIEQRDESVPTANTAFMRALIHLKNEIKQAIFKGVLK